MDLHFVIVQSFGIIATICFLLSYQVKSNKGLYLLQAAGCGAFAIQYFLLGAYTGCLSQVFVIVRNLMLSKYNQWAWVRFKGWLPIFIAIAIVITWFSWDGPISLIPLFIITTGTIGMWTNNAGIIRLTGLTCISPPWIVYDIIVGAYSAILNEVIIIVSVLISIYRFGWRTMIDPEAEFQKK
ncbi:MAG: YgjV family protein [Firmicutes bacterium]|nr:YgjV family protein [Bacillota bacterium]